MALARYLTFASSDLFATLPCSALCSQRLTFVNINGPVALWVPVECVRWRTVAGDYRERGEREREREIEKRVRSESLFFFIPLCWITWADYVPLPKVTAPVGGPLSLQDSSGFL